MPAAPRLKTPLLLGLAEELRFAPRPAVIKDIQRAIETVGLIEPGAEYPADWIVFRVTGYRREQPGSVLESVPGSVLLADLARLIEVLSAQSKLARSDVASFGEGFDQAELTRRWNVSRKTLERYRKHGLLALRVLGERGRSSLFFPRATTEAFEQSHKEKLGSAAGFRRLSEQERTAIRERAARLRRRAAAPQSALARHLAKKTRRSPGTVARLLPRAGKKRSRIRPRTRLQVLEKWESGIGVGVLASQAKKSRPALVRLINLARFDRLEQWDPSTRYPADAVLAGLLTPERIAAEFPRAATVVAPPPETDLQSLVDAMSLREAPDRETERQLVRAHHACMHIAAKTGRSADALDVSETCLRWSAKLRSALVRPYRIVVIESLQSLVGLDVLRADPALLAEALLRGLAAAGAGLELFVPASAVRRAIGGTLAAPVSLAVGKALTEFARSHERELASLRDRLAAPRALKSLGAINPPDWTEAISPWQHALLRPELRRPPENLDPSHAESIRLRFGLGPQRPQTIVELASRWSTTRIRAAERVQRAVAAAVVR